MTKQIKGNYELQAFKNGETRAESFFFDNWKDAEENRKMILYSFKNYNPIVKIFNADNIAIEFQRWKKECQERISKIASVSILEKTTKDKNS